MLPTVWQGLGQSTVTHLVIKFPTTREPKPIALAPPVPDLKSLKIYDIDPLCYPDDISLLLLESKKLEALSLVWNRRMLEARELSVTMNTYFGRFLSGPYRLSLKSVAYKNLYTHHTSGCQETFDFSRLEKLTWIDNTGGLGNIGESGFLDPMYRVDDAKDIRSLRMIRIDKVAKRQVAFLSSFTGLEKVYLVGPQKPTRNGVNGTSTPLPNSPASSVSTTSSDCTVASLKDQYIEALTRNHGSTLKHLLLMPQWRLDSDDIATIVKNCPNLEQLGFGVEFSQFNHLRLLVPFLPKLIAIRLLANPDDSTFEDMMRETDVNGRHEEKIGNHSVNQAHSPLMWMELAGLLFHIDKTEHYTGEDGRPSYRRSVTKKPREAAQNIDIWAMDSLDV